MNPEIKKQWLENLRSGDYKQGVRALRDGDSFCCLGVLCDMAEKAGVVTSEPFNEHYSLKCYGVQSNAASLPEEVIKWSGLDSCSPRVTIGEEVEGLPVINDDGATFKEIADLIEASL